MHRLPSQTGQYWDTEPNSTCSLLSPRKKKTPDFRGFSDAAEWSPVQQWGGYEDLKTLQVYAHYVPSGYEVDALNAAIEREQTALKEAISA